MGKFYKKEKTFMSTKDKTNSGYPSKPTHNGESKYIAEKGFRDLRYSGVIATKADPQTTATTASQPYAIIASTNRVKDANYPGDDNLTGNVVTQLMTSNNSKLMNNFDSGRLEISVNYLYLNYDDSPKTPHAANKYMGAAINEALSRTNSEMLTNLPFAQYTVETKCASMDNSNHGYVVLLYQTILQNCATILGKYVELMSLEKHLIDMGYNREAYFTIELFGLLKKKAFVQKLNALSVFIQGEYFDQDWYKQINVLTLMPSRKSFSIRDPLLTIKSSHRIPSLSVKLNGTDLFSTDSFKVSVGTNADKKDYTMEDLCKLITARFDQASVLDWARNNYSGARTRTAVSYFNEIVSYIDYATMIMSRFSSLMSDTRTYLDVMNKLGLNNWKQGTTFDVSAISNIEPSYNVIVANVFKAYLASPTQISWDAVVQRWQFYSFWDEFTGIATYDKYSGGSFLTFSVRDIQLPNGVELDSSELLVPKLFSVREGSVILVSRQGYLMPVSTITYTTAQINANNVLARLNSLPSIATSIRMPSVNVSASGSIPFVASAAFEVLQTVAGIGQIVYGAGANDYNIAIDRDLISLIDIQMNDVTNAMLSFCRAYSPFKVWLSNGSRTIGFGN